VVSAGPYILSALSLAAVGLSIGFSAYRLRQRLLPTWTGAPARLVEAVMWVALLIWLGEILGTLQLFYDWALVASSLLLAGAIAWFVRARKLETPPLPGGGAVLGDSPEEAASAAPAVSGGTKTATGPAGPTTLALLVTWGVIALVFAHWGITTKNALDRGIFNFDSLWYHMPFAVDIAKSHSTTGLHYVDTVFTNWFYPQNAELLHAIGILLVHRDTLSLFVNFGFLAIAFLAAWCIGRPFGRGHLTVVAAAIVLECHTLVVREPGAAKNDLVAAALLLAAAAILVNAWPDRRAHNPKVAMSGGWPLAIAGLAVGLAVGTKSTAVAMAAGLTVAVIVLAPTGKRWTAAGWWFVPALLGGGYWYLRNLIVAGNPLPQATSLGPISLPHPERLQEGRPDFNIVHYATDVDVWREYFAPGLHQAFGVLWPAVLAAAAAGGLLALFRSRQGVVRWLGAVALFGMAAYLFTPLSAAGAEGAPVGFGINIRYAIPPLLLGITLLPLALLSADGTQSVGIDRSESRGWAVWKWGVLAALLLVLVVTDRSDAALRDPARTFGIPLALLLVLLPAGLLFARRRGVRLAPVVAGFGALAVTLLAIGYPLQRHYLRDRFGPGSEIPGMHLEAAYRWARGESDAGIGIVGTTAGFLQYGLYGTDLSNRVVYLGEKGPHGAFNAIPTCTRFRAAVNAADLEYLVTAPFLNFIHTDEPISSPEARWLRHDPAAKPFIRSGPVTVWKLTGRLDPSACDPANRPLHHVPNTPQSQSQ
jgi:hypothetical protein